MCKIASAGIESILSPKQQRQTLPSLLSLSFFMVSGVWGGGGDIQYFTGRYYWLSACGKNISRILTLILSCTVQYMVYTGYSFLEQVFLLDSLGFLPVREGSPQLPEMWRYFAVTLPVLIVRDAWLALGTAASAVWSDTNEPAQPGSISCNDSHMIILYCIVVLTLYT